MTIEQRLGEEIVAKILILAFKFYNKERESTGNSQKYVFKITRAILGEISGRYKITRGFIENLNNKLRTDGWAIVSNDWSRAKSFYFLSTKRKYTKITIINDSISHIIEILKNKTYEEQLVYLDKYFKP